MEKTFVPGQIVEVVAAIGSTPLAKVTRVDGDLVYAILMEGGVEYTYPQSHLRPSEATDEQFARTIRANRTDWWNQNPDGTWKQYELPKTTTPPKNRWLCLDCGNTYNGPACPVCGDTERIECIN